MTAGTITKCTATGNGGGIFLYMGQANSTTNPTEGYVRISGGTISRGTAANGGGIYLNSGNASGGITRQLHIAGGTITGNSATSSGGGIAVGDGSARVYFSGAPYIYGNTGSSGEQRNFEMNRIFTYNNNYQQNDSPGTVIVARGLIRGATIGVYVPGSETAGSGSAYDKHGFVEDPFGTYDGSKSGLNYFINDRNGLKGGLYASDQPDGNKKIYWKKIYALSVTKRVMSDDPADLEKEYSFTLKLTGNSAGTEGAIVPGGTNAENITRQIGDLYFDHGEANFTLKNGETKMADLLPLQYTYTVTENLSDREKSYFKTSAENGEGIVVQGYTATGTMWNENQYAYPVTFSNLSAVCKITVPDKGLLYIRSSEGELAPAVYSNLSTAFNRANSGEAREWYYLDGEEYERIYPEEYRIEMLIPDFEMDAQDSIATLVSGKKVTLTTAEKDSDDGFPYAGSGAAKITRAMTGNSMFTVYGDLILDNIILDGGNGEGWESSKNGGILRVNRGGTVTAGTGVSLQNSTVTAGKDGAGIYLAEGSKLYIFGEPVFSGNKADASSIASEKNGGEPAYSDGTVQQDIYIAGYSDTDAASLVVTGNLTGSEGSIWVWAEDQPHYW